MANPDVTHDEPVAAAAVIVCGGHSHRMGRDKASLPFGPATMLGQVVQTVGSVLRPVIVVSAVGQTLPELPADVVFAVDEHSERGPLEGLRVGLAAALELGCDYAFVCACDAPLIKPAVIRRLLQSAAGTEICIPKYQNQLQPLLTVYTTRLLHRIEELLGREEAGPFSLIRTSRTRQVDVESLRDVDPDLLSFRNVNTPEDYQAALRIAGY